MQLHSTSGKWHLGLALTLVTVVLWGVLPIALKITLQALDVYTLTWFRFLVAFTIVGIYLTTKNQLPPLEKLRSTSPILMAIATLFLALNYIFFLKGLALTSPANAQVIMQLAPVFMGLGGLTIFKEKYTLTQWVGVGILTLGLCLFFNQQLKTLITAPTQYLLGCGLIVIAATVWAIYALVQKQLLKQLPSSNIMLIIYGGCIILFTPTAVPTRILNINSLHWGALIFCCLNTVLAYGSFAEALEHWEASKISALLATTPVFTLFAAWLISWLIPNLIAPERLTLLALFGAVLVVVGSITIALGQKR